MCYTDLSVSIQTITTTDKKNSYQGCLVRLNSSHAFASRSGDIGNVLLELDRPGGVRMVLEYPEMREEKERSYPVCGKAVSAKTGLHEIVVGGGRPRDNANKRLSLVYEYVHKDIFKKGKKPYIQVHVCGDPHPPKRFEPRRVEARSESAEGHGTCTIICHIMGTFTQIQTPKSSPLTHTHRPAVLPPAQSP